MTPLRGAAAAAAAVCVFVQCARRPLCKSRWDTRTDAQLRSGNATHVKTHALRRMAQNERRAVVPESAQRGVNSMSARARVCLRMDRECGTQIAQGCYVCQLLLV